MADSTTSKVPASSSTAVDKKVRRRRKMARCCGLYSPLTPTSSEQPRRRQANVINERATGRASFIRESSIVSRAFALRTKIHGMRSVYRAEGQWKFTLVIRTRSGQNNLT